MRVLAPGVVGLGVVLAGCLGSAPGAVEAPLEATSGAAPQEPALRVEARDCVEGGGHSVYNMRYVFWDLDFLPEPWVPADVSGDVGGPVVDSLGFPVTGPVTGVYHTTVVCGSWTYEGEERSGLVFGFVAVRVEAPPFDPGGATRHYLLDVFSMGEESVQARFHAAGVHVTRGSGLIDTVGPFFHSVLDDEEHGVYETHVQMEELGAKDDGTTRLWMLHEGEEGKWHPMAIDMADTGGKHVGNPGEAVFSHTRTRDHEPVPGAAGQVAALGYEGFARVLTLGPMPEVTLEEGYEH